jgi:hypothetical protein
MLGFLIPSGQIDNDTNPAGACDDVSRLIPDALVPFRYDTAFIRLAHAGGTSNFAASKVVPMFAAGVDDNDGTIGALNNNAVAIQKTPADTNVYQQGALVQGFATFRAVGMSARVGRPFVLGALNERSYPPWLDEYRDRAVEAVYEGLWLEFAHAGTKLQYYVGKLGDWPSDGGPTGPVINNGTPMVGQIGYFRAIEKTGAKDMANKLVINLHTGNQGIDLPDDPGIPAVADIIVPVRIKLYGEPSGNCDPACMPPGVSQAQFNEVVRTAVAAALAAAQNR